jgi:hypothetical protein
MQEIAHATMLRSSSRGVSRVIWSFGSGSRLDQPVSYSKAPAAFGAMDGLIVTDDCLTLEKEGCSGSLVTGSIEAEPFNWMVPWWNAGTAGSGSLEIFLQFGIGKDGENENEREWSKWYPMGLWAETPKSFSEADENAKVETDTLILFRKARCFRLKLTLSAGGNGDVGAVVVHRFGVIVRDTENQRPAAYSQPSILEESETAVPCRSQMVEGKDIRGRICSPTCAAMALEYLGISLPTAFVAANCYDAGAKIYGNWPFNVASLWELGAAARLDYIADMETAAAELAAGHLLIASIRFGEGELAGAPISKTKGHLVLLTGIRRDNAGAFRILVNDPAAPAESEVKRGYDPAEFGKAWTGVAYIVEGSRYFKSGKDERTLV